MDGMFFFITMRKSLFRIPTDTHIYYLFLVFYVYIYTYLEYEMNDISSLEKGRRFFE